MLIRKVEVGQRVNLRLFKDSSRPGTKRSDLFDRQTVQLANQRGIAFGEDGLEDPEDDAFLLPGRRIPGGVAHEMHDAALPGRAGKDLLDRTLEPFVGIAGHADNAGDFASSQGKKKTLPAIVGLGVDGVHAENPPVAIGSCADCRDQDDRVHMALVPALEVGGIKPKIGKGGLRQVPVLEL